MTLPGPDRIDPAISATWPAGSETRIGSMTVRDGGGGQRATAATLDGPLDERDIEAAERAMAARGESLIRVRHGEDVLDRMLEARGYEVRDVTNMLVMPVEGLAARRLPPVTGFAIWPPLAIMEMLWDETGIGPERRAVMGRVRGPKSGLLGRGSDQPGGVGFVAAHHDLAMIHAVAVLPHLRRQKIAENMMISAGKWAQDVGAAWIATLCLRHNSAANELYASLGMTVVGSYHYRAKKPA